MQDTTWWSLDRGCRDGIVVGQHSPPTNVAQVQFSDPASHVGWVHPQNQHFTPTAPQALPFFFTVLLSFDSWQEISPFGSDTSLFFIFLFQAQENWGWQWEKESLLWWLKNFLFHSRNHRMARRWSGLNFFTTNKKSLTLWVNDWYQIVVIKTLNTNSGKWNIIWSK